MPLNSVGREEPGVGWYVTGLVAGGEIGDDGGGETAGQGDGARGAIFGGFGAESEGVDGGVGDPGISDVEIDAFGDAQTGVEHEEGKQDVALGYSIRWEAGFGVVEVGEEAGTLRLGEDFQGFHG